MLKLHIYGYRYGVRSSGILEREARLNIEVRWLLGEIVPSNKTIAIDSFKLRAQNSLKNNYNQGKIDRHLDYIDNRIREFENALDQSDREEEKPNLQRRLKYRKPAKVTKRDLKRNLTQQVKRK